MNRRSALGALGGLLALPAFLKAKEEKPEVKTCSRIERYKEYRKLLSNNPELQRQFDDEVWKACMQVKPLIINRNTDRFSTRDERNNLRLVQSVFTSVAMYGDAFFEKVSTTVKSTVSSTNGSGPTNPLIYTFPQNSVNVLPVDTMYRIETIKGKLIEFQQGLDGPDYVVLSTPLGADSGRRNYRFKPEDIFHVRVPTWTTQPYGLSPLEAIRTNKTKEFKLHEYFGASLYESYVKDILTFFNPATSGQYYPVVWGKAGEWSFYETC